MILAEFKLLLEFPLKITLSKITLSKWCQKLGFCYKQRNKKMQVHQQFDADIVLPACKFIKNETPLQVSSGEFCKFFQPNLC